MTKQRQSDEWLRDANARQRNVVFPDTVANETRFWCCLVQAKQRLTAIQKIGLCVLGLWLGVLLLVMMAGKTPESAAFSRRGLGDVAIAWVIAFATIGGFLLLFRWSQRKTRK